MSTAGPEGAWTQRADSPDPSVYVNYRQEKVASGRDSRGGAFLSKGATLDFHLAAEMAVMATGLLTANHLRKRQVRRRQRQQHDRPIKSKSRLSSSSPSISPELLGRCFFYCRSLALSWVQGVAWTSAYAYGGLIFIRLGQWALLLLPHLSSDQESSPSSSLPVSPDFAVKDDMFVGHGGMDGTTAATATTGGGGGGGGGMWGVVMANQDGLAVALAVAMTAAAVSYALTGAVLVRRVLGFRVVWVPLGLAAELLRAGCITSASEIILAFMPSGATLAEGGSGAVALSVGLGLLRVLASAFVGAAMSSVGGGGAGEEQINERAGSGASASISLVEGPPIERTVARLDTSVASSTSTTATVNPMVTTTGVAPGLRGATPLNSHEKVVKEDIEPPRPVLLPWFVPSGALGGAFYALTAGGVFRNVMREYIVGEEWFSSPSSVRAALGVAFSAVYLLRSLAASVDGRFNPIAPCYRLLAFGDEKQAAHAECTGGGMVGGFPGPLAGAAGSRDTYGFSPRNKSRSATTGNLGGGNDSEDGVRGVSSTYHEGGERATGNTSSSKRRSDYCFPNRFSTVRGQTRPGPEGVDLGPMRRAVPAVGDDGEQIAGTEALAGINVPGSKKQSKREARVRRRLTLAKAASSNDGECPVGGAESSEVAEVSPRRMMPKEEDENVVRWTGRGGGGGGGGGVLAHSGAEGSGARNCHPTSQPPSPALAAAAPSSGSITQVGASKRTPFPFAPSATVGASGGRYATATATDTASTRVSRSKRSAGVVGTDFCGGSSAGDSRASASAANSEVGGVPSPSVKSAARPRRASVLASSPTSRGRVEEDRRRRSTGSRDDGSDGEALRRGTGARGDVSVGPEGTPVVRAGGRRWWDVPRGKEAMRPPGWSRLLERWTFPAVLSAFLFRQVVLTPNRNFWVSKALDAWSSRKQGGFLNNAERAFLLGFPHGVEMGVFAAAIAAAARVRMLATKTPGLALGPLLTCLGAFGGNILASLVVGAQNMVLTEDIVWPAATAAWLLVGGRLWVSTTGSAFALRDLLSLPVVHHLLVFLSEACRARLVCRAIDVALAVSTDVPDTWAPAAATGAGAPAVEASLGTFAVLSGVLAGCGGMFLPGDRGLSPLSSGVPWTVQSALLGSALYYYCCLSGVLADTSQVLVSLIFVSAALVQTTRRGGGPRFNPLSPLHGIAYFCVGLEKPRAVLVPPPPVATPKSRSTPSRAPREFGAGRSEPEDKSKSTRRSEDENERRARLEERRREGAANGDGRGGAGAGGAVISTSLRRQRRNGSNNSERSMARGSSSRGGRGRGTTGQLAGAPCSGRRAGGRPEGKPTPRGLLLQGAGKIWGPGGVGAGGIGRAFIWTVATATVIGVSRLLVSSITAISDKRASAPPRYLHKQNQWQAPAGGVFPLKTTVDNSDSSSILADVASIGANCLGFEGDADSSVVGDADAAAGAAKGADGVGARCRCLTASDQQAADGSGGSGRTSVEQQSVSGTPAGLGAVDLLRLDPLQLVEQVLTARKAAADAAERADVAERAAAEMAKGAAWHDDGPPHLLLTRRVDDSGEERGMGDLCRSGSGGRDDDALDQKEIVAGDATDVETGTNGEAITHHATDDDDAIGSYVGSSSPRQQSSLPSLSPEVSAMQPTLGGKRASGGEGGTLQEEVGPDRLSSSSSSSPLASGSTALGESGEGDPRGRGAEKARTLVAAKAVRTPAVHLPEPVGLGDERGDGDGGGGGRTREGEDTTAVVGPEIPRFASDGGTAVLSAAVGLDFVLTETASSQQEMPIAGSASASGSPVGDAATTVVAERTAAKGEEAAAADERCSSGKDSRSGAGVDPRFTNHELEHLPQSKWDEIPGTEETEREIHGVDETEIQLGTSVVAGDPGGTSEMEPEPGTVTVTVTEALESDPDADWEDRIINPSHEGGGRNEGVESGEGMDLLESLQTSETSETLEIFEILEDRVKGSEERGAGESHPGIGSDGPRGGGAEEVEKSRPPSGTGQQEQQQLDRRQNTPGRDEKTNGRRVRAVGVVFAAAYYVTWAVVLIALG